MKYWDVNVIRTLWIWPCGAELLVQRWTLHQSGGGQRACRRTAEPGRTKTEQFGPDPTGPVPAGQMLVFFFVCFFAQMFLPWKTLSFDLLGIWFTPWQLVRGTLPSPRWAGSWVGACLSVGSLQRHKATQHLFLFFFNFFLSVLFLAVSRCGFTCRGLKNDLSEEEQERRRRRMEAGGGGARGGRGRVLMKDCFYSYLL